MAIEIPPLSRQLKLEVPTYTKDVDQTWTTYVEDHRSVIIETSTTMVVDPDVINEYLYRPIDFLKEHLRLSENLYWIFMYINNLTSNMGFNRDIDKLYIPSQEVVSDLRQRYVVHITNISRNNKAFNAETVY